MVSSHGCFVWYELTTTDAQAAKAFYADVVGWGTRDASMPGAAYTLFTAGEVPVAGLMALPAEARKMGAQPRWTGYVGVDDVDAATDRLKRLGGTVYVPPTDVPDVSRFSVVADPQMATLTLVKWLHPGQEQPAALISPGHVGWHELSAVSWEKAFAFYSELFGWQKADAEVGRMGTYQLFSAAGQTIGGMSNKPPTVPMPFWLYYFNVGDLDAAAERVKAGGGKILEGPLEARGGNRIVRCTDPEGAMFALRTGRPETIGYFGRAAADDPAATRLFVPKKAGPNA
jgi:predicted enzyme related to lactoylglutathione lyase